MAAEPLPPLQAILVLAARELREAVRSRWFLTCAAIFTVLALAFSLLGLSGLGTFGVTGFGRTAASLLQLVMIIVPLMGLLMGAMSVAAERESGTLLALLAQPVDPGEVLLGKFLGGAAALAAAIGSGFALSGAVLGARTGWQELGVFAALAGFACLLSWVHLALGLLISVLARRSATALGAALAVWLGVVLVSDLGLMGTAMVLRLPPSALLWASLGNPVQAFRVGVLGTMGGALELLGPCGRYAMDVFRGWTAPVMVGWLLAWLLGPLALALRIFSRRGAA